MARIRTIKPEFWTHEDLSALPEPTHMLAAALLNHADDEGYFHANPGLVKAACSPLREPSVSIHDSLNLLCGIRFIRLGVGSDGKRYGQVVKFDEHQRVNRPTPSKIKALSIVWEDSPKPHAQLSEDSSPERNREQGTGNREARPPKLKLAPADASPASPPSPPVIEILITGGNSVGITQDQADEFSRLYPAVDVLAELRKMRGWSITNPDKRKTRGGLLRFVNTWLSRQQDAGGSRNVVPMQRTGTDNGPGSRAMKDL